MPHSTDAQHIKHHDANTLISEFIRRASTAHPQLEEHLGCHDMGEISHIEEDLSNCSSNGDTLYLNPDVAATAILMARHFAEYPELLERIRSEPTTGVIWIANPLRHKCALHVLRHCVFDASVTVTPDHDFHFHDIDYRAVTFVRTYGESALDAAQDALMVNYAIERELTVIGIGVERDELLPPELVRRTDWDIVLRETDLSALNQIATAITGYPLLDIVDPELARAAEFSSKSFRVGNAHTNLHAQSIQRRMISNLGSLTVDGPRLEALAGYGSGSQWGLNLATDLTFYRSGHLDWDVIEDTTLHLEADEGVGRRLFLAALSRSARVPLIEVDCIPWDEINSLHGIMAEITAAFAMADRLAPCILVFDEFELCLPDKWDSEICAQFTDHVERSYEVVVVISTEVPSQRPSLLPAKLLSKKVRLDYPGSNDLVGMFRYYLRDDLIDQDITRLALAGRYGRGIHVKNWVQQARAAATQAGRPLNIDDILHQIRTMSRV